MCARARVHGAAGVGRGATVPQAAGPSSLLTVAASLRNPPRSRPVARRPFLLRLRRPKFQTKTCGNRHQWHNGKWQRAHAHLILRVLFVVLRHVIVRGGSPTRPSLPTHDRQVGVEVSDRKKLRQTVAALGAGTGAHTTWAAATCASREASISVRAASSSRAGLLNQIDSVDRGSSRGAAQKSCMEVEPGWVEECDSFGDKEIR